MQQDLWAHSSTWVASPSLLLGNAPLSCCRRDHARPATTAPAALLPTPSPKSCSAHSKC